MKILDYMDFIIKHLNNRRVGGLEGDYTVILILGHLFQLWPGYWVKNMIKMNEVVGENNCLDKFRGKKQLVHHFTRKEFWKCMG